MNAIAPRGWCPTPHAPMQSGDGWLVRVRPPRGVLSAGNAEALGSAAVAFGNGIIELTQRAALQVRGLRPETVAPFAAAMVAGGLASPLRAPSCDVLRAPMGEADPLADAIERAMAEVSDLPPKFCVAVEFDGGLPLGDVGADIHVAADRRSVAINVGSRTHFAARDEAARTVASLARGFSTLRAARTPMPRRMRGLVAEIGADAVFAAAGLCATARSRVTASPVVVGPIDGRAFGLGLPFGAFAAAVLADLARAHGDGSMRLTPWRAVVLTGVADPLALRAAAVAHGLIVEADDPRRRVVACPGAPACASASVATRDLAARIVPPIGGTLHVSGCAKGCAHPGPAALTLVGEQGRLNLVRNGRAGDMAVATGLTPADAVLIA